MVKSHAEESLGANPGDAAINPADSVAMGIPAQQAGAPIPPPRPSTLRALRHPPFRLLFLSFIINQTGFWISHISLQQLMVDMTDSDARQSGLLFFVIFLPAFLFAPVAGVVADRFERKRIVISCYAAIVMATATLAVLIEAEQITPARLLAVAAFMGTAFAFSGPASMAIAANSVPQDDLASAVSLQSAANNLTRVAGPILATPFVAAKQFQVSFSLYLLAALIAGFLTFLMKLPPLVPEPEEAGILGRMRDGLTHARERQPTVPALLTVAVLTIFGVSHTVLVPIYATEVLGDGRYFTWMVAATGLGAMVGAFRTGQTSRALSLSRTAFGLVGYGLMLGLFGATRSVASALVAQLLVGYFYFAVVTRLQTLIQSLVDDSKRGRVMSLFQVCWAGLVPFGSMVMGLLAEPLGTPATLVGSASVCVVFGASMSVYARRFEPEGRRHPV